MQSRARFAASATLLACLSWTTILPGAAVSVSASVAAEAWLRARRSAPQQDELAELKDVNPEAYGLVKALLTKRSLGLLDPRHPSASFAAPRTPPGGGDESESGPAVFQKIAEESGERPKATLLYPEAVPAAPAHHNWLNWKPQQSALDDESMVKNVLGAVAELKGGSSSSSSSEQASTAPLIAAPADGAATSMSSRSSSSSFETPATVSEGNSYLKGIDLGLASATSARHASRVGLSSVGQAQGSTNYLASFSWDDEASTRTRARASEETPLQPAEAASPSQESKGQHPKNALLAWLGGPSKDDTAETATARTPAVAAAPAEENSYLRGLNLNSN